MAQYITTVKAQLLSEENNVISEEDLQEVQT